ncbi:YihY/virulence factor BrkB family protein [Halanaeroarchaeum sulfurireducens]|uniref:Ribonuclease BN n=1 Tax=Halanaeroarchaeum sulfurireducens TaxID=1604004 RepID=A0A0F7PBY9_9EURY|nr:YihY/virulence factor BrkB family protein [Halanaeroarchaeum sulfurireducens]AKH98242.1 ribonuclease BN [Halanaeroarchaeum sulfurireducens]ALG82636.1 ribonuclease BN [Halanaeroarchaeum sulfurireducens]
MSRDTQIGRYVPAPLGGAVSTSRGVVALAVRNLTYLAAGVAFYAFVAIIPVILLAVAVASFVGGEELAGRVTGMLSHHLSFAGQDNMTQAFTRTSGRGAASVVGFLGLVWSALKFFRGLEQAFDELYLNDADTSFLKQVMNGFVVVVGIALAVGLVVAVGLALSVLSLEVPFVNVLGSLWLMAVPGLAFLPIYYVLPPVDLSIHEVSPGAAVGAGGWVLLQNAFRLYAANGARYGAYGMIGAAFLFVTWLYFSSIVVLLGGAVNAVPREARLEIGELPR